MSNNAPVVMGASVTLARGNGGIDVDLGAMQTTSRNWVRIDEIRVWIDPGTPPADNALDGTNQSIDLGYIVDVSLKAGNDDLTSGFIGTAQHPVGERISYIPVFLLGPRIYRRFSTILNSDLVYLADTRPYISQNTYIWTLPRPLYLPPGTPLSAKFRRTSTLLGLDEPLTFPADFTVEIAAVGQKLAKPPSLNSKSIPFLQAWSPRPNVDPSTITGRNQKLESGDAFKNLSKETLILTRMIGGVATSYCKSYGISWATGVVPSDLTALWLNDGDGKEILSPMPPVPISPTNPVGLVPMSSLFMSKTNSFRISDRLRPNQVYRCAFGPVTSAADTPVLPMIALESFREVRP